MKEDILCSLPSSPEILFPRTSVVLQLKTLTLHWARSRAEKTAGRAATAQLAARLESSRAFGALSMGYWEVRCEVFSQKIYLLGSYDVFRCVCTTVWVSECDVFPACGEGKLEDTPPEPEGLMLVVCLATRSGGRSGGKFFVPPFSYLKMHNWWIFK